MIYIAHRGNFAGRNLIRENEQSYLMEAYMKGFHVEIDIWSVNRKWYFGHDAPQYEINERDVLHYGYKENTFSFTTSKWFFHCKNEEAMERLSYRTNVCYFWHENDQYAVTNTGHIWTTKLDAVAQNAIVMVVNPADITKVNSRVHGICTDDFRGLEK